MSTIQVLSTEQHLSLKSPEEIEVKSKTQKLILNAVGGFTVINAGPPGPVGQSGGNAVFNHDSPSDSWVVHHNLGLFPVVTVVDNENRQMLVDVQYVDENTITIFLAQALTGKVYLAY